MQKHSQHNNDERTHFFRKIYPSHFIRNGCERVTKVLCVSGELETVQTATDWPLNSSVFILSALLSRSAGLLNRVSWGPMPSAGCRFSLQHISHLTDSKLTEPVCGPGLCNCLTSTCFLWASHLHPIRVSSSLIGCPFHMALCYI